MRYERRLCKALGALLPTIAMQMHTTLVEFLELILFLLFIWLNNGNSRKIDTDIFFKFTNHNEYPISVARPLPIKNKNGQFIRLTGASATSSVADISLQECHYTFLHFFFSLRNSRVRIDWGPQNSNSPNYKNSGLKDFVKSCYSLMLIKPKLDSTKNLKNRKNKI